MVMRRNRPERPAASMALPEILPQFGAYHVPQLADRQCDHMHDRNETGLKRQPIHLHRIILLRQARVDNIRDAEEHGVVEMILWDSDQGFGFRQRFGNEFEHSPPNRSQARACGQEFEVGQRKGNICFRARRVCGRRNKDRMRRGSEKLGGDRFA
jgi:hypothetical protein